VNQDGTFHTVTSNDGTFESGKRAKGKKFSHSFEKQGVYEYHCTPHSYMKGKIVVNGGK
jgi:plastocyanin